MDSCIRHPTPPNGGVGSNPTPDVMALFYFFCLFFFVLLIKCEVTDGRQEVVNQTL